MVLEYLSTIPKSTVEYLTELDKKKIVDLYVHEIIIKHDNIKVDLKLTIGADKDGVGGLTLLYPHTET